MSASKPASPSVNNVPTPHAILFDWDNTLADTWHIIYEALKETFIEMGREPWSFDDIKQGREGIHKSLRDSFPRIFGDDWETAKELYYKSFLNHHLNKLDILPGAYEVLEALSQTPIFVGIVSNKTGEYLRREVTHLGWDHLFDSVIGATDAEQDKPHPAPIHLALKESDITPSQNVWFIGDSATDIACALNANCTPILYGEGLHHHQDHPIDKEILESLLHVKDHAELLTIVKRF